MNDTVNDHPEPLEGDETVEELEEHIEEHEEHLEEHHDDVAAVLHSPDAEFPAPEGQSRDTKGE